TLSMTSDAFLGGVVTGKPLSIGGTRLHAGATASGVVVCVRRAFETLDLPLAGKRVVLQGFGKVGGPLAFLLASAGMRVIAVADAGGAVLDRRGIVVVPDILANAGGVTASYFEWAQARQGYPWDDELVAERLRTRMDSAFTAVWTRAEQLNCSLRRAAFALALERV